MMRTICLYFHVHQPFRLKRYRFFDIGKEHYYFDDFTNENIVRKVADACYLPANEILRKLFSQYGSKFKVSFSISGTALDQFAMYAPEVLESFQALAKTGCIEFVGETYSHTLASLLNEEEFKEDVLLHSKKIEEYFGSKPKTFSNSEMIYSDHIGAVIAQLGFKTMLTEGAKHILGWKSPNYLYCNALNPKLKVLMRNFKLSDDLDFRFSDRSWPEFPLTTEKFVNWLNKVDSKEETINLFLNYGTFGERHSKDSGILDFLQYFPKTVFSMSDFSFSTPSEISKTLQPISAVNVNYPISWADEEKDTTRWLGNDLQQEACHKLYELAPLVNQSTDPIIHQDWKYLQTSDHFFYMCTKFFSDGDFHQQLNPYNSPYDAFINYMNILSDFRLRLESTEGQKKTEGTPEHLQELLDEKDKIIQEYESELKKKKVTEKKKPVTKTKSLKKEEEPQKSRSSKTATVKAKLTTKTVSLSEGKVTNTLKTKENNTRKRSTKKSK